MEAHVVPEDAPFPAVKRAAVVDLLSELRVTRAIVRQRLQLRSPCLEDLDPQTAAVLRQHMGELEDSLMKQIWEATAALEDAASDRLRAVLKEVLKQPDSKAAYKHVLQVHCSRLINWARLEMNEQIPYDPRRLHEPPPVEPLPRHRHMRRRQHKAGKRKAGKEASDLQPVTRQRGTDGQVVNTLNVLGDPSMSAIIKGATPMAPTLHILADTGSVGTIMGEDVYVKAFSTYMLEEVSPRVYVRTGLGHEEPALGAATVTWQMGGHNFSHRVLVVRGFTNLFVLGIDFLAEHHWTKPDPFANYYVFDGVCKVDFTINPIKTPRPIDVLAGRDVIIPPRSAIMCLARLTGPQGPSTPRGVNHVRLGQGAEGYFLPRLPRKLRPRLTAEPATCRVLAPKQGPDNTWPHEEQERWGQQEDTDRIVVYVTNSSDSPFKLRRGTTLGSYRVASQEEIATTPAAACSTTIIGPEDLDRMDHDGQLPSFDFEAHLRDKCGLEGQHLTDMMAILAERAAAFAVNPHSPPPTHLVQHHIDTGTHQPIKLRPYQHSPAEEEECAQHVTQMLEWGIIRPSHSPWSAPIVMVNKADGSRRFCFDARSLNAITRKDSYAMPRIDDMLTRFRGAKYFSVCDASSGFWQVPMAEDSISKTAFATKRGLFEFLKMPFGLTNAPATFQRLMEQVLGDLLYRPAPQHETSTGFGGPRGCAAPYIDDVIIYSSSWEQHMKDVKEVLDRLQAGGISCKLSKCVFGQQRVKYLGYIISRRGVEPDEGKLAAIRDYPRPTSVKEVQALLGTIGYYRRFIKDFSKKAEPLTRLTKMEEVTTHQPSGQPVTAKKKVHRFSWGPEQEAACELLKSELTKAPILAHPDFTARFYVHCDASDIGLGAVLTQFQVERQVVVAYYSKLFNPQQRRYSATEREALAIVKAVQTWRSYLAGRPFTVLTDHAALRYLPMVRDPTGRVARWVMLLQQYDFVIEHRRGRDNGNADGLSRGPVDAPDPEDPTEALRHPWLHGELAEDEMTVHVAMTFSESDTSGHVAPGAAPRDEEDGRLDATELGRADARAKEDIRLTCMATLEGFDMLAQVKELQRRDPIINAYATYLTQGSLRGIDGTTAALLADLDNFTLIDGLVYRLHRRKHPEQGVMVQLFVPQQLRMSVLKAYHESVLAGHAGINSTYEAVRRRYYWVNMFSDVVEWVRSCSSCAAIKGDKHGRNKGLHPVKQEWQRPFDMIGMDFVGPLPRTIGGNRYVLVIVDYATRWVEAFALPDCTAASVAHVLVTKIFLVYGPASIVLSDRGSHFLNELVHHITDLFQARQVMSSGYRPQTAGLVERTNGALMQLLAHYVHERQHDWDDYLPYVLFAHRTHCREATGMSPFALLLGYEPVLPHDLFLLRDDLLNGVAIEQRNEVGRRVNQARDMARKAVQQRQQRQKEQFDKSIRRPARRYAVGDLVFCLRPHVPTGTVAKLARTYDGPYLIMALLDSARTLKLKRLHDGEMRLAHIDNVKPYYSSMLRYGEEGEPDLTVPERPTEQQMDKATEYLDHAVRAAVRILPGERIRPVIEHALQDQHQAVPQPVPNMPSSVQPIDDLVHQYSVQPPTPLAEHLLPPPVPSYVPREAAAARHLQLSPRPRRAVRPPSDRATDQPPDKMDMEQQPDKTTRSLMKGTVTTRRGRKVKVTQDVQDALRQESPKRHH